MKKGTIAVLLALALLCALPAAAAFADAALPAVGDVVHGFEAVETRDYPQMDAVIVRFVHQKTGAELFYIANDDTNRAFDLTFFTDATDNTGLPHVFEHATTAGSEKYPSAALWFNLEYQTYNTFWNAMTGKRFTTYPCASLSEAQLLKYADYFTDSCLHPTLMDNEQVFRTEAWRYRLDDPDSELTIEGTVYSEMQGAWTLEYAAESNFLRAVFPGSLIGNDSGGDPDFIPDLTWEMLKNYHDRYYHPSNCAAYLYGQFEDYAAFLALLDGYFSAYERQDFVRSDDGYTPITEPVTEVLSFPVEEGSDTAHAAAVCYGFVCPGLNADTQQELVMNTLTDLLNDDASALRQRLREALPYGSFESYVFSDGPEDAVVFSMSSIDPEDAELFRATVDAALAEVAENGFPEDQVDGAMATLKITTLLMREGSDPVENVIVNMAGQYAGTGSCWAFQDYQDGLLSMDEWNRQGLYARAVSDWLLGSRTTALVTTCPAPGAKEEKDAALAERLRQIKAGMSGEEIAEIVAASSTPPDKGDAGDLVAQLQAVTVESLPEEWKLYDVSDVPGEDGTRRIDVAAGVDGIGQANIFLDAAGLEQADLHWFKLYTDLLYRLDTSKHDRAELMKLVSRYLYSDNIYLSVPEEGEGYHPYLRVTWIATDEDLGRGYELMDELLFDTVLTEPDKLLEQVGAVRADLKSRITSDPFAILARRALAVKNDLFRYNTYLTDLEYYDFLGVVEDMLRGEPAAAVEKLLSVQDYFHNRTNAVTLYAGNRASIELNRGLADAFLASLDARPIERADYDLPVPAPSEALVIDSGAQYNMLLAPYEDLGLEGYSGDMEAVANVVSDAFLFPILRDQYGVYTPMHGALNPGGIYVYAFRDPNIAETWAVLADLPDLVAGLEPDQEVLDGYIMSAYSGLALPQGELSGAINAGMNLLQGRPQDEALTWMRELKALTPESVKGDAEVYAKLAGNGVWRTAGGAAAINADAELFDVILNPFGAVDRTGLALFDVPEDSAHYEAVRFVFEEGIMAPLDGESFGADMPAGTGDLLAAAYGLMGGVPDAEEALEVLADYGIVPADTDLTAPVAVDSFRSLMSELTGMRVKVETVCADPGAVTRGELAELLYDFLAPYAE